MRIDARMVSISLHNLGGSASIAFCALAIDYGNVADWAAIAVAAAGAVAAFVLGVRANALAQTTR